MSSFLVPLARVRARSLLRLIRHLVGDDAPLGWVLLLFLLAVIAVAAVAYYLKQRFGRSE